MSLKPRQLKNGEFGVGEAFAKYINVPYLDRSMTILPGVFSNERYARCLELMAESLHQIYLRNEGDSFGQVKNDFTSILTLAGHPMNPLGAPAWIERKNDIPSGFIKTVEKVAEDMTSSWTAGLTLSISKMSHSGLPYMSHSLDYKASIIKYWIDKAENILEDFHNNGALYLLENHGISLTYSTGRRYQFDKIEAKFGKDGRLISAKPKSRRVWTDQGFEIEADKTLSFSRNVFRQRSRQVWAASGTFNYAYQSIVQGFRDSYSKKMKSVIHHESVQKSVESLPNGGVVASGDFSTFDHLISAELQEVWFKALEKAGVHPWLVEMRRYMCKAPAVFKATILGEKGGYVLGEFDQVVPPNLDQGVQSGIADVSDIDKMVGIAYILYHAVESGVILSDDFDLVYSDSHPNFRLRNMGDDVLMWFRDEDLKKRFFKSTESTNSFFPFAEDKYPGFLGNEIFVRSDGSRSALPNLNNGICNIFVPERGISTKLKQGVPRAFWAFGIKERNKLYNIHPLWDEVWNTAIRSASSFYNMDFSRIIEKESVIQQEEATKVYAYESVYDKLFLQNPTYIHYRFSPSDVTKDLLDLEFLTIPEEEVYKLTSKLKERI